jgi:hypothetical protein
MSVVRGRERGTHVACFRHVRVYVYIARVVEGEGRGGGSWRIGGEEGSGERIRQAGATNCAYATGLFNPLGLAFDPHSGAVFVANAGTASVCRVPPGGGASAFLACTVGCILFVREVFL